MGAARGFLPDYDYEGSRSPAELASWVDGVVAGTVTDAGTSNGPFDRWHWLDLTDIAIVHGEIVAGATMRVSVEEAYALGDALDPELLAGLRALVFVIASDRYEGGYGVALEGLWFACDDTDPAVAAMLAPSGDGWPKDPTIDLLIDLVTDPPVLDDPDERAAILAAAAAHRVLVDNTFGRRDFPYEAVEVGLQLGQPAPDGGIEVRDHGPWLSELEQDKIAESLAPLDVRFVPPNEGGVERPLVVLAQPHDDGHDGATTVVSELLHGGDCCGGGGHIVQRQPDGSWEVTSRVGPGWDY